MIKQTYIATLLSGIGIAATVLGISYSTYGAVFALILGLAGAYVAYHISKNIESMEE